MSDYSTQRGFIRADAAPDGHQASDAMEKSRPSPLECHECEQYIATNLRQAFEDVLSAPSAPNLDRMMKILPDYQTAWMAGRRRVL